MPACGVTVKVFFEQVSSGGSDQPGGSNQPGTSGEKHRVTIESSGNGSVSLENNSLMAGETVIFYARPNQNAYFKNAYAVDANNNTLPCEYDSQTQQGQLTMPDCDIRIIVEFSRQPDFPDPVNPVYSVEEINQAIEDGKTVISVDGNVTIGKGQSVVVPEGVELVIYRTTLEVDGGTLTVNGEISAVGLTTPMASISGNHYEAGLTIASYSPSLRKAAAPLTAPASSTAPFPPPTPLLCLREAPSSSTGMGITSARG